LTVAVLRLYSPILPSVRAIETVALFDATPRIAFGTVLNEPDQPFLADAAICAEAIDELSSAT